jgi:WD40 repeat protein
VALGNASCRLFLLFRLSMANKLSVRQIFGISGDSRNALDFSSDHHIVYNAGAHVVVLNTETKEQGFISTYNSYSPTQKSLGCTALTCSYPKKFIAIAERGESVANIVFYDSSSLRKKRMLNYPELGSKEYKCIAFSDDGRLFLSQGAGPDWNLVLWSVEKSVKVVTTLKVSLSDDNPVNQISFCPWDSTLAVAVGKGFVSRTIFIFSSLSSSFSFFVLITIMLVCCHITNCCTNTITRLFSTQSYIHSLITFTFLLFYRCASFE